MKMTTLISMSLFCVNSLVGQDTKVSDVLDHWEKVSSNNESVVVTWTEQRIYSSGSLANLTSNEKFPKTKTTKKVQHYLALKTPVFFKYGRVGPAWKPDLGTFVEQKYVNVFDGAVSKCFFEYKQNENGYHNGFMDDWPSDWDNYHLLPILLYLRASNPYFSPIHSGDYVVASKRQVVNGSDCLVLKPESGDQNSFEYVYYVDPQQGFAIKRFEKRGLGRVLWSTDCEYEDRQGRFFPTSWKTTTYSSTNSEISEQHISKVERCDFQTIDQADFDYEFPIDTVVTDRTGDYAKSPLVFIKQENGKRVLTGEERRNGIKFKERQDTETGEVVGEVPQQRYLGIWLSAAVAGILFLIVGTLIYIKKRTA